MIRRPAAALLVALVVALTACGDDSGSGEQSSGSPTGQRGGTGPAASTAPAGSGATGTDDPRKPDPGRDERTPEQTTAPEDRGKGTRGYKPKPVPRRKLIYEQSRYLCGQVGIEGLQREYGIESTDPRTLARAVSRRTSMRGMRAAVYSGCLAGLGSGD